MMSKESSRRVLQSKWKPSKSRVRQEMGDDGVQVLVETARSFPSNDRRVETIGEAWTLFVNATKSFDADVHLGTAVLCHAAP